MPQNSLLPPIDRRSCRPIAFRVSSGRGDWLVPAIACLLAAALLATGCGDFGFPFLAGGPSDETIRAAVNAPVEASSISSLLETIGQKAYETPEHRLKLRGVAVAVSLISLGEGGRREPPMIGFWRGRKAFPAGRMALLPYTAYYLAHQHQARFRDDPLADGRVRDALRSPDNGRIGLVVDTVTGTTSGEGLEGSAYEEFRQARFAPNEWLEAVGLRPPTRLGYKEFDTMASPRDQQLAGVTYSEGNEVGAEAMARLLVLFSEGAFPAPKEGALHWSLLRVERSNPASLKDHVIANVAPAGTPLWGISSRGRDHYHDAVVFDLPGKGRFALVILTDKGAEGEILARLVADEVFAAIRDGGVPIPKTLAPLR
jgi:hypothetical protein